MIRYAGSLVWGKLTREEQAQVNWKRTVVRGLAALRTCSICGGDGETECGTCHGTKQMPCSVKGCGNVTRPGVNPVSWCCRGSGKEPCTKCAVVAWCRRCGGDGAVEVEEAEALEA